VAQHAGLRFRRSGFQTLGLASEAPLHRQLPVLNWGDAVPSPTGLPSTDITESQNSRGWKGPLWVI